MTATPPRLCRCGEQEEFRTIRYPVPQGESFVVVENVPAWVCPRCGETYIAPEVSERLEEIVTSRQRKPSKRLRVPVFAYTAA